MEDVAAACGVTKLIVYRHFGSKEDLYREILQQVFDHLGESCGASWPCRAATASDPARCSRWPGTTRPPSRSCGAMRHASRSSPAYAAELRSVSAAVVRQLSALDTGDELLDAWHSEVLFGWLVEATLTWLEQGRRRRATKTSCSRPLPGSGRCAPL